MGSNGFLFNANLDSGDSVRGFLDFHNGFLPGSNGFLSNADLENGASVRGSSTFTSGSYWVPTGSYVMQIQKVMIPCEASSTFTTGP